MKAWAALAPDQIKCVDIPIPEPGDYEALIKIEACVFCNSTDWMVVNQHFGAAGYPVLIGHESFGKVIKTGKHVRSFKVGDRVTGPNAVPYGFNGKYYSVWGGFAEYGIVGDYKALKQDKGDPVDQDRNLARFATNLTIPADFSLDRAGLAISLSEAVSCITQLGSVKDKSIVVLGTGIAGLAFVMLAKLHDVEQVICVGRRAERLA
ncbi:MAG: alcohol dehydrogenase catalytic domain-containing protein, partial [Bacillota bacterium]|nr:alcohol dehydrogenase catalytic domain-containing protein [Bacillota bacterium]